MGPNNLATAWSGFLPGRPLNATQEQQISLGLRDYEDKQRSNLLSFKAGVKLGSASRTKAKNIIVELKWELFEILREHGSGQRILSETQLLRAGFVSVSPSKYERYYGNHVLTEVGHAWACWAIGSAITPNRMPTKVNPDCVGGFWGAIPPSSWQNGPLSGAWPASRPPPPVLGQSPKSATLGVPVTEYVQSLQTGDFRERDQSAWSQSIAYTANRWEGNVGAVF